MASGPLFLGYNDEVDVGSCYSQAAGEGSETFPAFL